MVRPLARLCPEPMVYGARAPPEGRLQAALLLTMHVLLIHQAFAGPDDPGGTRHYELGSHLVAKGHRFTVITSRINYLTGAATTQRAMTSLPPGMQIV